VLPLSEQLMFAGNMIARKLLGKKVRRRRNVDGARVSVSIRAPREHGQLLPL
jgi:hypothetical protein